MAHARVCRAEGAVAQAEGRASRLEGERSNGAAEDLAERAKIDLSNEAPLTYKLVEVPVRIKEPHKGKRLWCGVPMESTVGRTICTREGDYERYGGFCSVYHQAREKEAFKEGMHFVSEEEGWRRVKDPYNHDNHYVCHPCSVKCHSCGRGTLITSIKQHVQKCEHKMNMLAEFDDKLKTKKQAYYFQYPQGTVDLDQLNKLDSELTDLATSGSQAQRRDKKYRKMWRRAKKALRRPKVAAGARK